jgi:hypothetical protein
VVAVERAPWRPPDLDPATSYGLLLLDGLIGRRTKLGSAGALELLGAGDILRPWEEPCRDGFIRPTFEWLILEPARLAVLDGRITRLIGEHRQLTIAFSGRLVRRARFGECMTAISHLPRVEERLLGVLWHLASTWGRVVPSGVYLPFRLTHELLGELIGARRPSVTVAIQSLKERAELVRRSDGTYLLTGHPSDWNMTSRRISAASDGKPSEHDGSGAHHA